MRIRSRTSGSTRASAPIWLLSRFLALALAACLGLSTAQGQNQGQGREQNQEQDMDAESAIGRLFRDGPVEAGWFTPGFLEQVPLSTVRQLVGDLKDRFGPLREVRRAGARLLVRLEGADVPARATLDDAGRITGLWLETAIPTGSLAVGRVQGRLRAGRPQPVDPARRPRRHDALRRRDLVMTTPHWTRRGFSSPIAPCSGRSATREGSPAAHLHRGWGRSSSSPAVRSSSGTV